MRHSITITVTDDEATALRTWRDTDSDLSEVLLTTGIDLLSVLANVAENIVEVSL